MLKTFIEKIDFEWPVSVDGVTNAKGFGFKAGMQNIIQKVLTSPKKNITDTGSECIFWLARGIDEESLTELLEKDLKAAKNPKQIKAICVTIVKIVDYYGPTKIDLKKTLPYIVVIANKGTNVTKGDAMDTLKTIASYLPKIAMDSLTKDLIEHQVGELQKFYDENPKPIRPEVVIKRLEATGADGEDSPGVRPLPVTGDYEINLDDFIEEVNIWGKFSEKWCKKYGELKKWVEKEAELKQL